MLILDVPQSGSVAGVTSSRNRFGQYRRTRAIPVQPRSPKQTSNRAIFTSASSAWRLLSSSLQTAWNDYAAGITRTSPIGSSYQPTGASLFVGSSVASQTPSPSGGPPSLFPTYSLLVNSITYVDPTPGPEAFTVALGTTDPNNMVLIETSGPVSPGITSSAAVRRWRSLPHSAANLGAELYTFSTSTIDILTEYNFLYPSPTPGQVIWFRFRELFYEGTGTALVANQARQTFRFAV